MELEGNLWPLSLSLLFASASILLPPPLRGILSSFVPSILPSFSLVDGNVYFNVRGFAVQGWLFVEMGETGEVCGQAGTGDRGDAVKFGQQLGDEMEEDWHGKWTHGVCDTAEAAQAALQ